jgi:hypothetical protein
MKPATREEYEKIVEDANGEYYTISRWVYYSACLDIVREIDPDTVLEFGVYKFPLIHGSDIMDNDPQVEVAYEHDATMTPWPIADKQYDLLIALQVWEHLEGKQREAFQEAMRVSRHAILSFPYMWKVPPDNDHFGIDDEVMRGWTCDVKPERIIKLPHRHMYYFKFGE